MAATRRLALLRHAKSSWDDARLADHDRPLNARGRRDAPRMGRHLHGLGFLPERIVSSTARRARATAEAVAAELGYPRDGIVLTEDLYAAPAARILEVLAERCADATDVIVVCHNPGITELANCIGDARLDNLPTCGFFRVEAEAEDWTGLPARPGRLTCFVTPKQLDD